MGVLRYIPAAILAGLLAVAGLLFFAALTDFGARGCREFPDSVQCSDAVGMMQMAGIAILPLAIVLWLAVRWARKDGDA